MTTERKEKIVSTITPSQLILSKDGSLRVAFFDMPYEVEVKKDDKGRKLSSRIENRLFIHIELPHDPKTVVRRLAGERKVVTGEDVNWVAETILFERAYKAYLEVKNGSNNTPQELEIEQLRKQVSDLENKAKLAKENASKPTKSKVVEEVEIKETEIKE